MEWQDATVPWRGGTFDVLHFDVGQGDGDGSGCDSRWEHLARCEDELGAVLWHEAVGTFLDFISGFKTSFKGKKVLELGAGTGVCGMALAIDGAKSVISDLPALMPLLEHNAERMRRAGLDVRAHAIDWVNPGSIDVFDVVVLCEVLYANREAWPGLVKVLDKVCARKARVFLAITLRNKRHDIDDFVKMLDGILVVVEERQIGMAHDNLPVLGLYLKRPKQEAD